MLDVGSSEVRPMYSLVGQYRAQELMYLEFKSYCTYKITTRDDLSFGDKNTCYIMDLK